MLVVQPLTSDEVSYHPSLTIRVVVEIDQSVADHVWAENYDSAVATSASTEVALVYGHIRIS
jgi:hypothetical protein